MSRFTPDTLRDAVLRPIAMAAPDGWVYIEILAADFRFVFILSLMAIWLWLAIRRKWKASPSWPLLAFVAICFVPWLYTSGNGRYFIPMLLGAGPLCVALAYNLPVSRGLRFSLVILMVVIQGFAVSQNNPWAPWNSWGLATWSKAPYFAIDLDEPAKTEAATYITLSVISYGLIAPLFPESSRWINLSSQTGGSADMSLDGQRIQQVLKSSKNIKLLIPSLPAQTDTAKQPNSEVIKSINVLLFPHKLALVAPTDCRLQRSNGLAQVLGSQQNSDEPVKGDAGFWICSLSYPVEVTRATAEMVSSHDELVFQKLESSCPTFFIPGQIGALPVPHGKMRHYQGADMRAYVLDDDTVFYKYHRTLNPTYIGQGEELLSGKTKVDCAHIRGRSGLPWEREI